MDFFRTVLIISIVIEWYIDSVYISIDFYIFSTDFCIIVYKVSLRIFMVSQLINTVVQLVIIKWCLQPLTEGQKKAAEICCVGAKKVGFSCVAIWYVCIATLDGVLPCLVDYTIKG